MGSQVYGLFGLDGSRVASVGDVGGSRYLWTRGGRGNTFEPCCSDMVIFETGLEIRQQGSFIQMEVM